jgi:hypothetical protein
MPKSPITKARSGLIWPSEPNLLQSRHYRRRPVLARSYENGGGARQIRDSSDANRRTRSGETSGLNCCAVMEVLRALGHLPAAMRSSRATGRTKWRAFMTPNG